MASSSYSPDNARLGKHDVFLSFRGVDTRNNFVSFLHRELVAKNGIETYIDYRLGGGEDIEPSLLEKIQESLISIVIFSKNYADSVFCLRELCTILECKKTKNQIILPAFYQVDPTDVQELRGNFAEGLAKLEGECSSEEMENWKDALTEIANLKGWDSNVIKPDTILVESIVDDVQKKLRSMPLWDSLSNDSRSLIGIDSRINKVESLLCIGSTEVIVVGIWGMPGIGKTTVAQCVYDRISHLFHGSCFFNNVREESQKQGLLHIRNQILGEVLEVKDVNKLSYSNIQRINQRKKVLIVLDDVSSDQQLEEALGKNCLLGQGSRIIVTSRDKQLLENCCDKTYKATELDSVEAFQLFKLHAFKGIQCPERFKELSERALNYAKGNPLSLRVLGSNLYNKDIKEWEIVVAKLKETLDPEIHKILKMSYDELDWKQKRIFLDTACFFRRCNRYLIQHTLDYCGFNAKSGIDRLIDLSLLNTSGNNEVWMHDSLQQLGQDIVHEENFDDPRKRSRLWMVEDIEHVLRHHKGTETLQAISLNLGELVDEINLSPTVFEEMCNLRFLEFYNTSSKNPCSWRPQLVLKSLTYLPNKLRFLRWDDYPLKFLPTDFRPRYLTQLRMNEAKYLEELWDNVPKSLQYLKSIEVYWADKLISVDRVLYVAPNLEVLCLNNCPRIKAIDLSNVPKLEVLNLRSCEAITAIDLSNVPKLVVLCLSDCTELAEAPCSIEKCTNLTTVDLSCCRRLRMLPSSIGQLKCLATLNLFQCYNLSSLPNSIDSLDSLIELNASCCNLNSIPASVKRLPKLTAFILCGCKRLYSLPELPSSLLHLDATDCIHLKSVQSIFTKVEPRNYEAASEYFNFISCHYLDDNSYTKIISDARLRIERMAISMFKQKTFSSKPTKFRLCISGMEVPDWFSYKNCGSSLKVKPPASSKKEEFLGFAFGAVVAFELFDTHIIDCECQLIIEDGPRDLNFSCCQDTFTSLFMDNKCALFLWYDWSSRIYHNYFLKEASFNFYAKRRRGPITAAYAEVINCGVHLLLAEDCEI